MLGGAVLNATTFIGGSYLTKYLNGDKCKYFFFFVIFYFFQHSAYYLQHFTLSHKIKNNYSIPALHIKLLTIYITLHHLKQREN